MEFRFCLVAVNRDLPAQSHDALVAILFDGNPFVILFMFCVLSRIKPLQKQIWGH